MTVTWNTSTLDIANCDRVEFMMPGDDSCWHRFESWPKEVRDSMDRAVKRWQVEHQHAVVRAATTAAVANGHGRQCVLILHFEARDAATRPPPQSLPGDATRNAVAGREAPAASGPAGAAGDLFGHRAACAEC